MLLPIMATLISKEQQAIQVTIKSRLAGGSFSVDVATSSMETSDTFHAYMMVLSVDDPDSEGTLLVGGVDSVSGNNTIHPYSNDYLVFSRDSFTLLDRMGPLFSDQQQALNYHGMVVTPQKTYELKSITFPGGPMIFEGQSYSYELTDDVDFSDATLIMWLPQQSLNAYTSSLGPDDRARTSRRRLTSSVTINGKWPVCNTCATQVHLSYGEPGGTGMVVSYTTISPPGEVSITINGVVHLGSSVRAQGVDLYFHKVEVTGLQPLTEYSYTIYGEDLNMFKCVTNDGGQQCFPLPEVSKNLLHPSQELEHLC